MGVVVVLLRRDHNDIGSTVTNPSEYSDNDDAGRKHNQRGHDADEQLR